MSLDEKTERALRVLLDKQEIHEVLMRYCRGIDRCDAELLHSVYHPDATDDHGLFKAAPPISFHGRSKRWSGMTGPATTSPTN